MKTKLSYKVLAAFIPTSFLAVALMIGTIQVYAPRRFADYVNWTVLNRLDGVMAELAKEYQAQQGWEALKANPSHWREILRPDQYPSSSETGSKTIQSLPLPLIPAAEGLASSAALEPDKLHQTSPQPGSSGYQDQWSWSIALFDADKRLVIGEPEGARPDSFTCRPIRLEDRVVGWLGLHKRDYLSDPFVVSFLNEQLTVLYLIGGSIMLLVAVLSFLLSNHLLAPFRQIRQFAGQLAEGTRALAAFRARTRDELGLLASNCNQIAGKVEGSDILRRQWIANISHDLRTPLAILRGEIEALRDGLREPDEARLESLLAEVVRLGKLFDDLHMLFLGDAQGLLIRKVPIEPVQVLKEMVTRYEPRFATTGLALELDIRTAKKVQLAGDPDRLVQLFSNLLENTLRYTDSPGRLRIVVTATMQQLSISFEDSAPGVPASAFKRLFDRLYQVDPSRSQKAGGSGLGLSICREIVIAHGGSIQAENSPLGGLKITITLPLIAKGRPCSTGD